MWQMTGVMLHERVHQYKPCTATLRSSSFCALLQAGVVTSVHCRVLPDAWQFNKL